MDEKLYLGTGMKFPPQVNKATGRFVLSSQEENVKESIYLILMTQKTERFMRPEFGSEILSYAFADTSETMLALMQRELERDILQNEPRVENVTIRMDAKSRSGYLMIYIDYQLRGSSIRDNMVFPFYLSGEPEEESEAYETMEQEQS
ncbi:MAG: GPW/gp25 family protein [Clostridium sp.]|nr:GPW/gp25 family protein [Clostridium sp.]DAK82847.1 MAG TPA: Baseplate wedge protein [Caudoviricetes sp.]